jgi:uncharacterized metal-binding protein
VEGTSIPKYGIHTTINLLIGLPFCYCGFFQQQRVPCELVVTSTVSFIVGTLLLSPDLDLRQSIPTKNWGILKVIWVGYHRMFKHRGKSHSLLFSCVTKLIYLLVVTLTLMSSVVVAINLYRHNPSVAALVTAKEELLEGSRGVLELIIEYKNYILATLTGIVASDWIHIVTDRVCSAFKRAT